MNLNIVEIISGTLFPKSEHWSASEYNMNICTIGNRGGDTRGMGDYGKGL